MGAFHFFVVCRFPFKGTKGSVEEKRQNEIHPTVLKMVLPAILVYGKEIL